MPDFGVDDWITITNIGGDKIDIGCMKLIAIQLPLLNVIA